jgi:hypothetical protein
MKKQCFLEPFGIGDLLCSQKSRALLPVDARKGDELELGLRRIRLSLPRCSLRLAQQGFIGID